jgi:hypothetical protein
VRDDECLVNVKSVHDLLIEPAVHITPDHSELVCIGMAQLGPNAKTRDRTRTHERFSRRRVFGMDNPHTASRKVKRAFDLTVRDCLERAH